MFLGVVTSWDDLPLLYLVLGDPSIPWNLTLMVEFSWSMW